MRRKSYQWQKVTERKQTLCWLLTEAKKNATLSKSFEQKKQLHSLTVQVPDRVLHPRNGAAQSLWRNGKASRNLLSSNCEVESQNGLSIHNETYKKTFKICVICLSKWASSPWEKVTESQASEHLLPSNSMYDQQMAYRSSVNPECLCGIFLLDIWLKLVTLSCSRNGSCLTSALQAHGAWFEDQLSKLSSTTEKRDTAE